MKHFISLKYFSKKAIENFLTLALDVKKHPLRYKDALRGKKIGLLFQKPSLRTKTSFYIGALTLGAGVIYYSPDEVRLGEREDIGDVAGTLSRYLDGIVLRTFSHEVIERFAASSSIPVVNGLSDLLHPSQVLGDLLTIYESCRDIGDIKVSYIGDGNNVCHSLLYAFSLLGGNLCVATPPRYGPQKSIVAECLQLAKKSGACITFSHVPKEAACDADVLYTDVWISMGKEKENKNRKKAFRYFTVDNKLVSLAKRNCIVMHCLPAHRGQEISDSVLDGKHSVVMQQAENRLYSAQAILLYILGGRR